MFKKGDKVVRKGTKAPIYVIIGKTAKVVGNTTYTYTESKEDYFTCDNINGIENPVEISENELQLSAC